MRIPIKGGVSSPGLRDRDRGEKKGTGEEKFVVRKKGGKLKLYACGSK